ncbi:hypothetical protein [Bartonella vinsonii]|uniref:Uncharacterized protein n=1 Tax=Bartonella vinsonii subsp. berkhoffii str. Tweed TaxID=1094502 RepID=N6VW13_BARVB|nr:hypothetical protein [Bartonella vinsonii]ENN95322.1 hypothetical protein BVtw_03280 [Bartonella vinsonii subsp. berkhoffii str. Tweed]
MILWMKRNLMLTSAVLAAFFMILARAFTLGKKVEQQKQIENALKTAKTRRTVRRYAFPIRVLYAQLHPTMPLYACNIQ